ncbi:hypothetical protein [Aliiglaciecola aliphaticivorans]
MLVKCFQFLGLLFPVVVIATGEYFLQDLTPETPLYSGAASFMGVVGTTVFAFMIYAVTVIPTSLILLTKKNREYFRFQSIGWQTIMYFNWAIIVFCGLYVVISASFGFFNTGL